MKIKTFYVHVYGKFFSSIISLVALFTCSLSSVLPKKVKGQCSYLPNRFCHPYDICIFIIVIDKFDLKDMTEC